MMKLYRIPDKISVLIFDIDGTLYQNEAYMQEQVTCQIRRYAAVRGISEVDAQTWVGEYREQWRKEHKGSQISLADVLQHFGVPMTDVIAWREELLHPEKYLHRDPQLVGALEALSQEYTLVCVTNNAVAIGRRTLDALGCGMCVSACFGLDTYNVSKPDTRIFEFAAKSTGAPLSGCISIGDRYDIDVAPALQLGMGGIVTECIDDIYRLPDILHPMGNKVAE
ncbi:MAG: HAD family hydrolase [Treponema sp.]